MASIVDHQDAAKKRLIIQYKESDTIRLYLDAVLSLANDLERVFCDLLLKRFIDTAEGVNLDIIGELVGQPRVLIDASIIEFFGFEGDPTARGFTSLSSPETGGRFRSVNESTTGNITLTDEDYRLFIRARIIKNNTRASREDIIAMIIFVFGAADVEITEGDRAYLVNIGKVLTNNERALVQSTDLLPKPQGIKANYAFNDPDAAFSFASISSPSSVNGFSTLSAPDTGGEFSSLI